MLSDVLVILTMESSLLFKAGHVTGRLVIPGVEAAFGAYYHLHLSVIYLLCQYTTELSS